MDVRKTSRNLWIPLFTEFWIRSDFPLARHFGGLRTSNRGGNGPVKRFLKYLLRVSKGRLFCSSRFEKRGPGSRGRQKFHKIRVDQKCFRVRIKFSAETEREPPLADQ